MNIDNVLQVDINGHIKIAPFTLEIETADGIKQVITNVIGIKYLPDIEKLQEEINQLNQ